MTPIQILWNITAIAGIFYIVLYWFIPLTKCLGFALGYTGLMYKNVNWTKAKARQLSFIKTTYRWFIAGIIQWLDCGDVFKIQYGKYRWFPYFKYEKIE